jgi:putative flippase GtrA
MRAKIPIAFGCAIGVAASEVVRHGLVHINWIEAGIAVVIAFVVVFLIPARFFERLKR